MKGAKSSVNRMDRINAELAKEVYAVLTQKLKNPNITAMISVLKADVSKDLKHAKVFLSIYSPSEEKAQKTFEAIVSESKRVRHELAISMRLRTVPEIHFILDDSMAYSDRINKLINSTKESQ